MRCEYCGSVIRTVPDNGVCPNCGGVMETRKWSSNATLFFPNPPVGMYSGGLDYVIIGENYVKLYAKYAFNRIIDRVIPFDEIYSVKYIPGTFFKVGFLCVRERKDKMIPMPMTHKQAVNDVSTIGFDTSYNEKFYDVYLFLKKCADIANGEKTE